MNTPLALTGQKISSATCLEQKALNGAENPSRIWAYLGMIILPFSYAIFFVNMSKKLPEKKAAIILKYGGAFNFLCMFLIVTSLHDLMLNISLTLFWTCMVVITVFIVKTRLHLLKFLCIVCLADFLLQYILMGHKRLGFITNNAEGKFYQFNIINIRVRVFYQAGRFCSY